LDETRNGRLALSSYEIVVSRFSTCSVSSTMQMLKSSNKA
jgi:hypothetical protein